MAAVVDFAIADRPAGYTLERRSLAYAFGRPAVQAPLAERGSGRGRAERCDKHAAGTTIVAETAGPPTWRRRCALLKPKETPESHGWARAILREDVSQR